MLESRAAYGFWGEGHGFTGEDVPDANTIIRNMPYREYKTRYSECKNLGDYDKVKKTISVILPKEIADRPNFDNRYGIHYFYFLTNLDSKGFNPYIKMRAKSLENATKNAKKWAKQKGFIIIRKATFSEYCDRLNKKNRDNV